MTDSSGSSDDDQVLLDIMESHDDNHNNIVCLFSMFVMECYDEDEAQYEYEHKWGGSPPGRIKKIERDFQGSFEKLEKQYFNGESSTYTEEQFERRFRVPRVVFAEVWGKVEGKGPFKQHYDCVTAEPGIHPLVRMVACWRRLSYGDASDRSDENFQISETSLDDSFKDFCLIILQEFGQEYLNRCPTNDEIKRTLRVNSNRGFPGLFASWDCKHFPWDMCPMAEAGQHKGKEKKNTLILEAICDPDTYIWYCFFGEPGSLNDLNILEKSTIVGSILNGTMDLRLPQELHYCINGTVRDYIYFLVDGIYPKWPIFVSTVSDATPGSKDKFFATYQEAVRKDIERAFGVIVKKFDILSRSIRFRRREVIRNVLHTCIILHNMTVIRRRKDYMSERVYYHDAAVETVEDDPLSLFGSLQIAPDGSIVQEAIGSRLHQIDAALHNELEHYGLMYDLKEHIWNKSNNSNAI